MISSLKVHSLSGKVFVLPIDSENILIQSFYKGIIINTKHRIKNSLSKVDFFYDAKVNYKEFIETIKILKDIPFTLTKNAYELQFNTDNNIIALKLHEFLFAPSLIEYKNNIDLFKLTKEELKRVSNLPTVPLYNKNRKVLNYLNFNSNRQEIVGTDGFMLTAINIKTNVKDININIDPNVFILVNKYSTKEKININYHTVEKKVILSIDNIEIISDVFNEGYPKYEQLVPNNFISFSISVKDLKEAMKEIKPSISKQDVLIVDLHNVNSIILRGLALTPNLKVNVDMYNNSDFSNISLNYTLLKNILKNYSSKDKISFYLGKTPTSPITISRDATKLNTVLIPLHYKYI